jgi:hypothetical protein
LKWCNSFGQAIHIAKPKTRLLTSVQKKPSINTEIMLEKDKGDPEIDQCIICLYKADYNLFLKIMWARKNLQGTALGISSYFFNQPLNKYFMDLDKDQAALLLWITIGIIFISSAGGSDRNWSNLLMSRPTIGGILK